MFFQRQTVFPVKTTWQWRREGGGGRGEEQVAEVKTDSEISSPSTSTKSCPKPSVTERVVN